jgi:hypothetical protein
MTIEKNDLTVSEMVRMTVNNSADFMLQIADHIDKLEKTIIELGDRISELESKQNESN